MSKIEFTSKEPLEFESEDGGQARIADADGIDYDNNHNGLFVRIHSWDEREGGDAHPLVKSLEGKKVKVTIEIVD